MLALTVGAALLASSPDAAAVLRALNAARAHPAAYAADLRRTASGYRGRYYREEDGTPHASFEGPAAVLDAADDLAPLAPLPPLIADPVLSAAARDHVEGQGREGSIGHGGADGTSPSERVRRRGGDIYVAEVIAYSMHGAADVVRELLVDDGVARRGHRRLLLAGAYRYAGIWCGPHATQETLCVIDLASGPGGRPHVPAQ